MPSPRPLTDEQRLRRSVRLAQAETLLAWRSCPFFRWYRTRLAAGHPCLLSAHPARHG